MKKLSFRRRGQKLLALLMAAALFAAFIPAATAVAESDAVYSPVSGSESWKTGESVYDGSNVTITKEVTARPKADTWDIEMTIVPDADIQTQPIEIALVLDYSGSMNASKISALKKAVKDFLDGIAEVSNGNVSVSLVKFNRWADHVSGMTPVTASSVAGLKAAVDGIGAVGSGYTNIEDGLTKGLETFSNANGVAKNVILFTDGVATADRNDYADGQPQNGTGSNPNVKFSEAAEAVAANGGGDITYYAIAFEITDPAAAAQAVSTLNVISKSGTGRGLVFEASGSIELTDVFKQIKQFVVSMVSDGIPDRFKLTSSFGSGNVKIEVIDSENPANNYTDYISAGSTIEWSPLKGELTASQKVIINYSLTLKEIPGAPYVYNNVDTNVDAKLVYSVDNELKGDLRFPEPNVRYETGIAIVNLIEKDTNNPLDDLATGFEYNSKPVITDFVDENGDQIEADNVAPIIRAPWSFRNADNTGTYILVGVEDELNSFAGYPDYLDTDDAFFNAGLPMGESYLKYIYELKPDGILTIIKKVTGDTAPKDELYHFELQIEGREPVKFSLLANEKKEFALSELDIDPEVNIKVVELKPDGGTYVDTDITLNGSSAGKGLEIDIIIKNIADSPTAVFTNNYKNTTPPPTPTPTTPPTNPPLPTTPPTNPPPTNPPPTPTVPTPGPDEEVDIDDGENPLGGLNPDEELGVEDGDVPLGVLPPTGDSMVTSIAAITAIIAIAGVVVVFTRFKKPETPEE